MLDAPLTENERAHLLDRIKVEGDVSGWIALWASILMVGGFGYFAYVLLKDGAFIVGGVLAAVAVAVVVLTLVFMKEASKPPSDWRVRVLEGALEERVVQLPRGREHRTYLDGVRVGFPPHWARWLKAQATVRARVATPTHSGAPPATEVPILVEPTWHILSLEGGPSAELERSQGLKGWPELSGGLGIGIVAALIGLVPGGVAFSYLLDSKPIPSDEVETVTIFAIVGVICVLVLVAIGAALWRGQSRKKAFNRRAADVYREMGIAL